MRESMENGGAAPEGTDCSPVREAIWNGADGLPAHSKHTSNPRQEWAPKALPEPSLAGFPS